MTLYSRVNAVALPGAFRTAQLNVIFTTSMPAMLLMIVQSREREAVAPVVGSVAEPVEENVAEAVALTDCPAPPVVVVVVVAFAPHAVRSREIRPIQSPALISAHRLSVLFIPMKLSAFPLCSALMMAFAQRRALNALPFGQSREHARPFRHIETWIGAERQPRSSAGAQAATRSAKFSVKARGVQGTFAWQTVLPVKCRVASPAISARNVHR